MSSLEKNAAPEVFQHPRSHAEEIPVEENADGTDNGAPCSHAASTQEGDLRNARVSIYNRVSDKSSDQTVTLEQAVEMIRSHPRPELIAAIRSATSKEERSDLKKQLLALAYAGVFGDRKTLGTPSEVGMVDLDNLKDAESTRDAVAKLPFVPMVWVTSGGNGVQFLIHVPGWVRDAKTYKRFMTRIVERSKELFGFQADEHCTDITRLSFLSHDPGVKTNWQAVAFPLTEEECAPKRKGSCTGATGLGRGVPSAAADSYEKERVKAAVTHIAPQAKNDYLLWLKLEAATKLVMGREEGIAFLKSVLPEHTEGEYEEKWDKGLTKITLPGFFALARELGWTDDPLAGLSPSAKKFVENSAYNSRTYHCPGADGYISLDGKGYGRHLKTHGVLCREQRDAIQTYVERTRSVDLVLDVAGYPEGAVNINGHRVLVTKPSKVLTGVPGECPTIMGIISEMLGETQLLHFVGWLKQARRALLERSNAPGQALYLLGPKKSGKTLLAGITQKCLTGRQAAAVSWLLGESRFNREVAAAGLLVADDGLSDLDAQTRSKLVQRIKQYLFARYTEVCAKFSDNVTLPIFSRLVVALNDNADSISCIPARTPDIEDKILLLRTGIVPGGTLAGLMGDDKRLMEIIDQELTAFLHFVDNHEIPAELRDDRTGVKSYWNPELLGLMRVSEDGCPITALVLKARGDRLGEVSACELLEHLLNRHEKLARALLSGTTAAQFGSLLAKLAEKRPDLIRKGRRKDNTIRWVFPPQPPQG